MKIVGKAKRRRRSRLPPHDEIICLQYALSLLTRSREELKATGAANTLDRVRLAISSCKGAIRNVDYKISRAQEGRG